MTTDRPHHLLREGQRRRKRALVSIANRHGYAAALEELQGIV